MPLGRREGPPPAAPPESFGSETEALNYFRTRYSGFTDAALQNRLKYGTRKGRDGKLRLVADAGSGNMLRGSLAFDLWPFVSKIRAPTLLVRGSDSQVVSDSSVAKMRQTLRNLEVLTVKGATHIVPQDRPAEFLEAVRSFLKKK